MQLRRRRGDGQPVAGCQHEWLEPGALTEALLWSSVPYRGAAIKIEKRHLSDEAE